MKTAAIIIGFVGVALYVLSYQFKNRKTIVATYSIANVLYIIQYIMLAAYTGMAMDLLAFFSSVLARKRNLPFIYKYRYVIIICLDVLMIAVGLALYENVFSLFAIAAVIIETSALWCTDENKIRKITLMSAPLWLTYNLAFSAYGSAVGSVLNIILLSTAIIRYSRKKEKTS